MRQICRFTVSMLTSASLATLSCVAGAQTIEKMKQFKVANTDLNLPTVPQEGRNAAAIRENLKKIKLPRFAEQLLA